MNIIKDVCEWCPERVAVLTKVVQLGWLEKKPEVLPLLNICCREQNWTCYETSEKTGSEHEQVKGRGGNTRSERHLPQQG